MTTSNVPQMAAIIANGMIANGRYAIDSLQSSDQQVAVAQIAVSIASKILARCGDAAERDATIAQLRCVLAEMYQFAGAVGAPVRVLDNLLAAVQGKPLPHATILPIHAGECDGLE